MHKHYYFIRGHVTESLGKIYCFECRTCKTMYWMPYLQFWTGQVIVRR